MLVQHTCAEVRKREMKRMQYFGGFLMIEAIQVMQDNPWAWFIEQGIPILFLTAIPAYLLWLIRGYIEMVVYNWHKPNQVVPQNARQEYILRVYWYDKRRLDILLLLLYASSLMLALMTWILLGGAQGLLLGIITGIIMISHLRHGIRLQDRVEKRMDNEIRCKLERLGR
jgi:hypothetical protein